MLFIPLDKFRLLTQVQSCRNCPYASFHVSFSTADAADNTYTGNYKGYYIISWNIGIVVVVIFACQPLPSSRKAKAVRSGVRIRSLSEKMSVSDTRSEWTGHSDLHSSRSGRSGHRSHLARSGGSVPDTKRTSDKKASRNGHAAKPLSRSASRSKSQCTRWAVAYQHTVQCIGFLEEN